VSQENVEIVRNAWAAYAARGLGALTESWGADIKWRAIEGAPDDVGEMDDRVLAVQHRDGSGQKVAASS
jgi:ketosteroid isomerase-like protein